MPISGSERRARLARLLKRLSPEGSIERLTESLQSDSAGEDLESLSIAQGASKTAESLEVLVQRGPDRLADDQVETLEAVIHQTLRPAIYIINDRFENPPDHWRWLADAATRARIEQNIPSIGRIELPGKTFLPYAGTGFVVGPNRIMTNRHVAELFADSSGDSEFQFKTGFTATINFQRERIPLPDEDNRTVSVDKVVFMDPKWDMALLEVRGLSQRQMPLRLSKSHPNDLQSQDVVVIGYPGQDPRGSIEVQNRIFDGCYRVKRLLPGRITGFDFTDSYDRMVEAMTHDASTLGGNSGSAVIHVATGQVLALHFKGEYLKTNHAVATHDLSKDQRVVDQGVQFVDFEHSAATQKQTTSAEKRFSGQSPGDFRIEELDENETKPISNSGSAFIRVQSGEVLALHFRGEGLQANFTFGAEAHVETQTPASKTHPRERNDVDLRQIAAEHDDAQRNSATTESQHSVAETPAPRKAIGENTDHTDAPTQSENSETPSKNWSFAKTLARLLAFIKSMGKEVISALSPIAIESELQETVWYVEAYFPGETSPQTGSGALIRVISSGGNDRKVLLTCQHVVRHLETGTYAEDIRCWRHGDGYHPDRCWKADKWELSGSAPDDQDDFDAKSAGGKDWILLTVQKSRESTNDLPYAPGFAAVSSLRRFRLLGYPGGTGTMERNVVKASVSQKFRLSAVDSNMGTLPLAGGEGIGAGFSGGPYLKRDGRIVAIHRSLKHANQAPIAVAGLSIMDGITKRGWKVAELTDKSIRRWIIRFSFGLVFTALLWFLATPPPIEITAIEGRNLESKLSTKMVRKVQSTPPAGNPTNADRVHIVDGILSLTVPKFEQENATGDRFVSYTKTAYRYDFFGLPLPAGTITIKVRRHIDCDSIEEFHEVIREMQPDYAYWKTAEAMEWFDDAPPLISIKFRNEDFLKETKNQVIAEKKFNDGEKVTLNLLTDRFGIVETEKRYKSDDRNDVEYKFRYTHLNKHPNTKMNPGIWDLYFVYSDLPNQVD